MKGSQEREREIINRIDNMINNNSDIPCLKGYRYFIRSGRASSSVYQYLVTVKNFMRFVSKDPKDLSIDDYTSYLGSIETKTSSYQITAYTALKKFSLYLNANKINEENPFQYLDRPKPVESLETQTKREKGFLTKKEIKKVKENIMHGVGDYKAIIRQEKTRERDLAIVMTLLSTGMRVSALIKLDIDNLYADDRSLKVVDKGGKTMVYPLADEAWDAMENWLKRREEMLHGMSEDALFLSSRSNKRLKRDGIVKMLDKYTYNIEGKHITPHKLRATYGTQLYNATKDIYFVQKCMNHSNPKTTELYVRGQGKETEEASKIMNNLLD